MFNTLRLSIEVLPEVLVDVTADITTDVATEAIAGQEGQVGD